MITPILLTILSKIKTGTFKNPVSIVSLWWGGWAFISTLGLLGLYVPSNEVYLLVLLFIIMFSFSALLVMKKYKAIKFENTKSLLKSTKRKLLFVYYMQFFVLLILIPYFLKSIPNILNMESSTYRLMVFNSSILYQSSDIRFLFNIIVEPIINIGVLIGVVGIFLGLKTKKIFLISVLNALLFSIMTLGRWYFLRLFFFLVIGYFIISRHKKIIPKITLKKNKKIIYVLAPVASLAMVIMSVIRSKNDSSILFISYEYVVRYFTAPFIALGQFLDKFNGDFYFGRVTLTPLDTMFIFFIRRIDSSIVNVSESISHYTKDFIHVGNGYQHNAFYTSLYNFYLDGGVFGVMIIAIMLGIIVGITFNKFSLQPNLFFSSLLVFYIYILIAATLRWEFINVWPLVVILYLFVFIIDFKLKNLYNERRS